MDILKKRVEINTWFLIILSLKTRIYQKTHTEFWGVVKHKIKKINEGKETDLRKDYVKIKFESDDDLPLNEPLIFYGMHIFVRFVFKEDDKLYRELFLDKTLCVKEM